MGKNHADRRCGSVWDSFIATQALQCIMQIKNYKGGEISKKKKIDRWGKIILCDINMPLNCICEQLEFKHTYAFWLPLFSLPWFLPSSLSSSTLIQPPPATSLVLSLHFSSALPSLAASLVVLLASNHVVLSRGFDTRRLLCTNDDSHPRSLCWALMQTTIPPSDAAKLTGTNSLWHNIAWVLRGCVCLLERGDLL